MFKNFIKSILEAYMNWRFWRKTSKLWRAYNKHTVLAQENYLLYIAICQKNLKGKLKQSSKDGTMPNLDALTQQLNVINPSSKVGSYTEPSVTDKEFDEIFSDVVKKLKKDIH